MTEVKPDRFAVVANAMSGAASSLGEAGLSQLVKTCLGDTLFSLTIAHPQDVDAALAQAFASAADVVVVIGGDGTCRAGAKAALTTGKSIAFMPGGTMNLLPARHWSGQTLEASLLALGAGDYERRAIDIGQVNDEIFLIAAAFGAAPTLARLREDHRAAKTLAQSLEAVVKIHKVLPHLLRPSVRLEADGMTSRALAALAIVVGDADFALGRFDAGHNDTNQQYFECVAAKVSTPWNFIIVMARAFFDPNWRQDPKVSTTSIREAFVRSKSRTIAMTLDGEVVRLAAPAHVRFLDDELEVLVQKPVQPSVAAVK